MMMMMMILEPRFTARSNQKHKHALQSAILPDCRSVCLSVCSSLVL